MSGHNVNIYFPEETYLQIKDLIKERKISQFVNKAVEKEIWERKKNEMKERMKADYQTLSRDNKMKEESKIWEGSIEDGI